MSVELENVYCVSGFFEFLKMIEVLNKIIELNYDEAKINDWIENRLVDGL